MQTAVPEQNVRLLKRCKEEVFSGFPAAADVRILLRRLRLTGSRQKMRLTERLMEGKCEEQKTQVVFAVFGWSVHNAAFGWMR